MVTEHEVQVVESGKADVVPDDVGEMLRARIPLNNNPRKAAYLSYRACFSVREACNLAGVEFRTVQKWRREDSEFAEWETGDKLAWLQHHVVNDLRRMEFMRNFALVLRLDGKLLYKANYNLEGMTDTEKALLRGLRKHYTPQDLIAADRALQPDIDTLPPGSYRESVTVTVEGRQVEGQAARQAAARELLERFEATKQIVEATPESNGEKALEGEVVT